mgnify:CR=1 FL=1
MKVIFHKTWPEDWPSPEELFGSGIQIILNPDPPPHLRPLKRHENPSIDEVKLSPPPPMWSEEHTPLYPTADQSELDGIIRRYQRDWKALKDEYLVICEPTVQVPYRTVRSKASGARVLLEDARGGWVPPYRREDMYPLLFPDEPSVWDNPALTVKEFREYMDEIT